MYLTIQSNRSVTLIKKVEKKFFYKVLPLFSSFLISSEVYLRSTCSYENKKYHEKTNVGI